MARKCVVCVHPKRKTIDKQIANKFVYVRISSFFDLPVKSIENHAKRHLKPLIEKVTKQVNNEVMANLTESISELRSEVALSTVEKIKILQSRLFNELDSASSLYDRVTVSRELRGCLAEEAKLTGAYQKDRENDETLDTTARNILRALGNDPDPADLDHLLSIASTETRINKNTLAQKVREFQNVSNKVH